MALSLPSSVSTAISKQKPGDVPATASIPTTAIEPAVKPASYTASAVTSLSGGGASPASVPSAVASQKPANIPQSATDSIPVTVIDPTKPAAKPAVDLASAAANAGMPVSSTDSVYSIGATPSTSAGRNGAFQITPSATVNSAINAPTPTAARTDLNPIGDDRQGLAYQLGGDPNFTGQLTQAIQASAAANSANMAGVGNAAATTGANSQKLLEGMGGIAQSYATNAATDANRSAKLLQGTGAGIAQQGNDVQGRAAPVLDASQQNYTLATAADSAAALQGLGGQAQQLGLAADGRAAPQAQLAGANAAIQAAQGNAGTVGNVGGRALALSQTAADRGAIAPANYGLSQAMLGQGVASSQGAQQTGQTLTGLEAAQGPSAAQAQLAQGQAAAAAQAMSLARSGRGWGGSAQGLADAQRAQAAGLMTANNQAAQLKASEDAAWRQRQASNLSTGAQIANQSAGLQLQAGTQLGQQAQANQAAALQSRAQNDQLQSQMYGYGLQGAAQAGQLNAAAGQQLSQNAIQQANIDQQATAQNDARLGQMSALSMQAQQQAAALQQQEAAQYGQQAVQNQQAALTQSAANDQFATNLYNTGINAVQASTQDQLAAGQLGLSGIQANGELASAGTTNALAGYGQQLQAATAASANDANALSQTGQLAQVQSQLQQNQVGDWLEERGINAGITTASRGQTMQLVGAGLSALGSIGGAIAGSDVTMKKNIMPDIKPERKKSYEELRAELSTGDSLLNPPPSAPDVPGAKKPFTLQDTENEYALGPRGDYGPAGVNPGRGSAVMGPGGPEYDKAMDAAAEAKANGDKNTTISALSAGAESFGKAMTREMPGMHPNFYTPSRPRYGIQPLQMPQLTSDARSKTDVKADGAKPSDRADLEEMRRAIAGLGEQAGHNMPERFAPPSGEILESAKSTPSYSWDYKNPDEPGAAPGRYFTPMAQDLAKQPATASTVSPGPTGKLMVDGGRLGMTAYAGLGQLARKQEEDYADLRRRIASFGAA